MNLRNHKKSGGSFLLLFLLSLFPGVFTALRAQVTAPPEELRISLLSCSPGLPLYSAFGHSAIRVQDPVSGLDLVFNYGTFDFNTPNFYWKFIRGKLLYQLSVQRLDRFLEEYQGEQRAVVEQEWLLSPEEKQRVWSFLQKNYLPDNRSYLYDFLFDNCATRIRDIAERELAVSYPQKEVPEEELPTFRQLLHQYLPGRSWVAFGFDLILGLPVDQPADARAQMFLPDYLMENLSEARLGDQALLGPPQLLLERGAESLPAPDPLSPLALTAGIGMLALLVSLPLGATRRFRRGLDRVLLISAGLLGLFFTFMWLGTDHRSVEWNLNLLWANPFYLLLLPWMRRLQGPALLRAWTGIALYQAAVLLSWPFLPQPLSPFILPLLAAMLLRSVDRIRELRQATKVTDSGQQWPA